MAKKKIRNMHTVQSILKEEDKFENPWVDPNGALVEDMTIQGQDQPLGELYQKLIDGTHIAGEYRVVYHEDDGKVDFTRLPDVDAKVDKLVYLTHEKEKADAKVAEAEADLINYKQKIQEKSRSRPKPLEEPDPNPPAEPPAEPPA
jgi:hypothetical protein